MLGHGNAAHSGAPAPPAELGTGRGEAARRGLTRATVVPDSTIKSRKPEAGSRKPEAGSRKPEAGSRKPEAGSRKPEAGSRKPEAGSRKPEAGSRKPEAGSRKPEAGSRNCVRIRGPCPSAAAASASSPRPRRRSPSRPRTSTASPVRPAAAHAAPGARRGQLARAAFRRPCASPAARLAALDTRLRARVRRQGAALSMWSEP